MKNKFPLKFLIVLCVVAWIPAFGQPSSRKQKIIIDQDAAGPAGTDQQSVLLLIQAPQTEVLGVTVVTGNAWLNDEVAHTLRVLELIGRTDIPVVAGAEYPLVRRKDETELWEQHYGTVGGSLERPAFIIRRINLVKCRKASLRPSLSMKTPHIF
jgi:purine nucleosidase